MPAGFGNYEVVKEDDAAGRVVQPGWLRQTHERKGNEMKVFQWQNRGGADRRDGFPQEECNEYQQLRPPRASGKTRAPRVRPQQHKEEIVHNRPG
jgi:hypothetical protein